MAEINPAAIETNREDPFPFKDAISVAVVTGGHPYNVPPFNRLFRSLPGVDAYVQELEQFCADFGQLRTRYDVVLFFNFHLDTPQVHERFWFQQGITQTLGQLGQTEQGIVILHHAFYAFQNWSFWSDLIGMPHADRRLPVEEEIPQGLSFGEQIHLEITDPKHPITFGIEPWDLVGETWSYHAARPNPDCNILMTTDHPRMSLKAMSWTHQFKRSRVFYLQPGHNNDVWSHPTFRRILLRGIQWAAGRL
jgi:hypothetical protein